MNKPYPTIGFHNRADGAALLAMTTLLLMIAALGAYTLNSVNRTEQRASGNDLRLKEVYAVATGTLESGTSWLADNFHTLRFTDSDNDGESENGDSAPGMVLPDLALTSDSYVRSITYILRSSVNPTETLMPRIIDIVATAAAVNDSHVTKTVQATAILASTGIFSPTSASGTGFSGPPLIVENCMGTVQGTPELHPLNGVSIGSTNGTANDVCLPPGQLHLNGGKRQALPVSQTLWESVFRTGMSETDLFILQELTPSRIFIVDRNYPHYPSSQPDIGLRWQADAGTATEPVILYFVANQPTSCTNIDAGAVIHGLVYYADPDCALTGFGGGTIHGTLAKAGDLNKLDGSTKVIGSELYFGGNTNGTGNVIDIGISHANLVLLPGSWRDY